MAKVFLSRRNLLTLLNKLDGVKEGRQSECTIIKRDTKHPVYPCTDVTIVSAVEDEEYYTDRQPGEVREIDNPDPLAIRGANND